MDYNRLLDEAKQHQKFSSDYELNRALGYKSVSAIYAIRKGKLGMRAPRLMKLLELAGKTLAGVATISAALLLSGGVGEAQAAQAAHTANSPTLCIMLNNIFPTSRCSVS